MLSQAVHWKANSLLFWKNQIALYLQSDFLYINPISTKSPKRNLKSDASIKNGQRVLAVIIYTSDDVTVSITDVLMLLVLAFSTTTQVLEAGTGSHPSLQPVTPTNGLISSH